MKRIVLKSKIHRAVVTNANLNYEGSISIDKNIMKEANIKPYEQVDVYNINNGERFTTYALESNIYNYICLNGAAARKVAIGDIIIICSYCIVDDKEEYKPIILKVS